MHYSHTQSQPVIAAALGVVALAVCVVGVVAAVGLLIVGVFLAAIALLAWAFSALTVEVGPSTIEVSFRMGRPKRVIQRADILRVQAVRNSWWYGWGVRWIPGGWMWNVWGLDAVELGLAGERNFRIGTDDPEGLTAAIAAGAGDAGVDGCWGV